MAVEALDPAALTAATNIVLGGILIATAVLLIVGAWLRDMPWSMLAATVALLLLSCATLVSALSRLEAGIVPNPALVLAVLRFAALILMLGAGWTLAAHYQRRPQL